MASKHHSLQMGEVADIVDLLLGFEKHNQVYVEVRMNYQWLERSPDLLITALAHEKAAGFGEVPPLASVSVRCLDTGLRNLRDVVIHVLYALDMQLALGEYARIEPKEQ